MPRQWPMSCSLGLGFRISRRIPGVTALVPKTGHQRRSRRTGAVLIIPTSAIELTHLAQTSRQHFLRSAIARCDHATVLPRRSPPHHRVQAKAAFYWGHEYGGVPPVDSARLTPRLFRGGDIPLGHQHQPGCAGLLLGLLG